MLDIGFSEILVVFVLALVVLGPEKLPRLVYDICHETHMTGGLC
jgi:Tat protein translocase TatB subunit